MAMGRVLQGSSRACSVGVGDRSRERKSARDPATGAGSLSARKDERVRTVFAFVKLVLPQPKLWVIGWEHGLAA